RKTGFGTIPGFTLCIRRKSNHSYQEPVFKAPDRPSTLVPGDLALRGPLRACGLLSARAPFVPPSLAGFFAPQVLGKRQLIRLGRMGELVAPVNRRSHLRVPDSCCGPSCE